MQRGGLQGAVLNGAKEAALEAFIAGRTGFLDIADIVASVMDRLDDGRQAHSIDDVYAADLEARRTAAELMPADYSSSSSLSVRTSVFIARSLRRRWAMISPVLK